MNTYKKSTISCLLTKTTITFIHLTEKILEKDVFDVLKNGTEEKNISVCSMHIYIRKKYEIFECKKRELFILLGNRI